MNIPLYSRNITEKGSIIKSLNQEICFEFIKLVSRNITEKGSIIKSLNNLIKKEENRRSKVKVIDIKEIYNKFKNPNQLTIKYLQDEFKFFLNELQVLKQNDISLEYKLLEL
ncbi:hypothetical protein CR513_60698, partial [Mucuna pruriens]